MSASQMLSRAIALAAQKHVNQFDKAGRPYILHCIKVMHYLKDADDELMAIAALHDVVEDTSTTYQELKDLGFSDRIIEGVRAMTKVPGQTPDEYLAQVLANPDSVRVKLADLRHNSDIRRLKGVTAKDIARIEKYNRMYEVLKQSLNG